MTLGATATTADPLPGGGLRFKECEAGFYVWDSIRSVLDNG